MDTEVSDAKPNTARGFSTLPEVVPEEYHHGSSPQRVPIEREGGSNILLKADGQKDTLRRPWLRRRLTWVIGLVAIVVIVALVVGLSVGLVTRRTQHQPTPTESSLPTPTGDSKFGTPTTFSDDATSYASTCSGTVCPTMLAMAQLDTDSGFFVFARGSDQAIWHRQASRAAWDGDWKSLGGQFDSQPAAVASGNGRVDVFATATDGSIRTKTYQDGKWTNDWLNLRGISVNPPTVCSWGPNNIEVFGANEKGLLTHRRHSSNGWEPALDQDWDSWGGFTSAAAAAVCNGANRVDVVSYGGYANALHDVGWMHYINGSWVGWEGNSRPDGGVGYRGDPALVAVDSETAATLGIGSDERMYYAEWSTTTTNYSKTETIGGSFESAPHILVTGNRRLDVLAVGTDNKLMHKARVGGTWAGDWEPLGGYFNSVPMAFQSDSGGEPWIAVFGLGPNGHMIHGRWTATDEFNWGEGQWFDDAGDISPSWFRAGPAR